MTAKTATTIPERPSPGAPRPYDFPAVEEHRLSNGLRILAADMPGRPLIAASLVLRNGAVDEPAEMERLLEMGVDGIITNFPERLRALCGPPGEVA